MSICTLTLKSVCKIHPRRWYLNGNSYSTRCIYFGQLFRFKLFKLYSIFWNVLIWLKFDFMDIFIHNLPFYLTYNDLHNCADTWRWIRGPIWIFEGKYRYWSWVRITNTDFHYYWTCQKKSIATQYVINIFTWSFIKFWGIIKT